MNIATTTEPLSDVQMVYEIRSRPGCLKLWMELTPEQRRRTLTEAEGSTWHIDELMTDIKENQ